MEKEVEFLEWIEKATNLLLVFTDCIDGDPMAVQFFDLRLVSEARELCEQGREILEGHKAPPAQQFKSLSYTQKTHTRR